MVARGELSSESQIVSCTFDPIELKKLSGGVVVLHSASTLAWHGFTGLEIWHTVTLRIASCREQAKELVLICGKLFEDHDAARRPLRGL